MKSTKKYYAVLSGRKTGIFHSWNECKKQVHRYSNCSFKSFDTLDKANAFMRTEDPKVIIYYKSKEELKKIEEILYSNNISCMVI